jgi:hypothetical protein
LAWAEPDQTVHLWDVTKGKEIRQWDSAIKQARALRFSADGKWLAGSDVDKVCVWEVASGRERIRVGEGGTFAFSPSGRVIAALGSQSADKSKSKTLSIGLWEIYSGQLIRWIDISAVSSLAFAPDGRTLAIGSGAAILLWDLTGRGQAQKAPAGPLTAAELDAFWSDLGNDAAKAETALWDLAASPQQSVPFLKERTRPAAPANAEQVAKLLSSLDSPELAVRQKATTGLEALGDSAEGPLRNLLDTKPALEIRQRIEHILDKRKGDVIHRLRAVEALEQIGTGEARQVLETLAKESPNPQLVAAAAAAVARLNKRQ